MSLHTSIQRLAILAIFLRGLTLAEQPKVGRYRKVILPNDGLDMQDSDITTHDWMFDDLPKLFPYEWEYNWIRREPGLKDKPGNELIIALMDFFDLNADEFGHLFDVQGMQQPSIYGGNFVMHYTEPAVIADNIHSFIRYRLSSPLSKE